MPGRAEAAPAAMSRAERVGVAVPGEGSHLPVFDGLRGIAILLVLLTHAVALSLEPITQLDRVVRSLARVGWTGVDLFFVLSGFLITGILLDTRGRPRWWRNFFARRTLRIFPLYYGALAFLFVLLPRLTRWSEPDFMMLQDNQAWFWGHAVNVLMAITGGHGAPLNTSHFWSLSIEEQFYLFWPFVVWLCSTRGLLRLAAIIMVAGIAFRLWLVLADPFHNAAAGYVLTPGRLDGLMTGAVLAVVARERGLARLQGMVPWAAGAGIAVLVTIAISRGGFEYRDAVMSVVGFPAIALVYGAALVAALTAPATHPITRALSGGVLGRLGKYSYGLYVFHYPILGALEWKFGFSHFGAGWLGGSRLPAVLGFALLGTALSYGIAWLSYNTYERQFLALKRYFR